MIHFLLKIMMITSTQIIFCGKYAKIYRAITHNSGMFDEENEVENFLNAFKRLIFVHFVCFLSLQY